MLDEKITGIYLAAGRSSRFGSNKLLADVSGEYLGSLALKAALDSMLTKVIVVTRPEESLQWLADYAYHQKVIQVSCPQANKGQSFSLRCGLKKAEELHATAVMIILADQPFITSVEVDNMIQLYKDNLKPPRKKPSFIASTYQHVPRPPLLLGKKMFPALKRLDGDYGARYLIRHRKSEGIFKEVVNPTSIYDIDTLEDYYFIGQHPH